jgi:hypothetical protein
LGDIIRTSYDFIFQYFDPAHDDTTAISNAFFRVEPRGQKERMEWLFAGLCREAGILPKEDKPIRAPQQKSRASKPRSHATTSGPDIQQPESSMVPSNYTRPMPYSFENVQLPLDYANLPSSMSVTPREPRIDPRYDLLVSLIEKLPATGTWNEAEHKLWVQVWDGALKMCVRVVSDAEDIT